MLSASSRVTVVANEFLWPLGLLVAWNFEETCLLPFIVGYFLHLYYPFKFPVLGLFRDNEADDKGCSRGTHDFTSPAMRLLELDHRPGDLLGF